MAQTVTVDKKTFQALHSAARALYAEALKTENHSVATLTYLTLLNDAIDAGHTALQTHRTSADKYIELTKGVTAAQEENIKLLLEHHGLPSE